MNDEGFLTALPRINAWTAKETPSPNSYHQRHYFYPKEKIRHFIQTLKTFNTNEREYAPGQEPSFYYPRRQGFKYIRMNSPLNVISAHLHSLK